MSLSGLGRWLGAQEPLLLFQRAWAQGPARHPLGMLEGGHSRSTSQWEVRGGFCFCYCCCWCPWRLQLGSRRWRLATLGCKRLLRGRSIRTWRLLVWSYRRSAPAWQRIFPGLIGYCSSQWEAAFLSGGRRALAVAGTQRKHWSARGCAEAAAAAASAREDAFAA